MNNKYKLSFESVAPHGYNTKVELEVDHNYNEAPTELAMYCEAFGSFLKACGFSMDNSYVTVIQEDTGKTCHDKI